MSGAVRAALAVFAVGVLGVWLVTPIGDACPDVGRLPAGSQSSSSPSFAPPLTRTCTYTTTGGTQARQRYVPVVDWLILAVVAGVVGVGVGLAGPGTPRPERAPGPERAPRAPRAERPERNPGAPRTPPAASPARPAREPRPARAKRPARVADPPRSAAPAPSAAESAEGRAAARERERQERARRRQGG